MNQTETVYEYVSGYCRVLNDHRIVECALQQASDGSRQLTSMDCHFDQCPHYHDCLLAGQARELES